MLTFPSPSTRTWLMEEHARLPSGNHAQDEVTEAAVVCLRELLHIEEVLALG